MTRRPVVRAALAALGIVGAAIGVGAGVRLFADPLLDTVTFSRRVVDAKGDLLRITLSGDEKYRVFTPLAEISPSLIEAVLLHEDRWFRWHPGLNPAALVKAFATTYVEGSRRRGGSTVTMQLARMTSTQGSRTLRGKLAQIGRALWIEIGHSKDEILEAYLNLLPYGGNVEGVGAASLVYFGKDPRELGVPEMLSLATIPQNPNLRGGTSKKGVDANAFSAARLELFKAWVEQRPEDAARESDLEISISSSRIGRLPFRAPHFVDAVLTRARGLSYREGATLRTSLDPALQFGLESQISRYVQEKSRVGVENASALILDWTSMEVVALVGSAGFFDESIQGQVNGTQAKRSPGSTLKPFTYALALDQGLIHPLTLLKDSAMAFSGFDPENYDRSFDGPVSATDALVRSRNVPAVFLASQLKEPSLHGFLRASGMRALRPEKHYGLALTLGGGEATMEELVSLYAGLANGGVFKPIRYMKSDPLPESVESPRLLSREASFLTLEMLTHNARDDQKWLDGWTRDSVPIAWKTGTSYGFRDAWTVGVVGRFVIAVWLGNFDGRNHPILRGRELAAPLFFRIADGLRPLTQGPAPWLNHAGLNVKRIDVCSLSGALPGAHCARKTSSWFIPGTSPIGSCAIHREIRISPSGLRVCDETRPSRKEVYEFWPSDILALFRRAGVARRAPPPFEPGCEREATETEGLPPQITSPRIDVAYSFRIGLPDNSSRVPLAAATDGDARALHWFIDSEYVGKSEPSKSILWNARPGKFLVRVVDDLGRSSSRPLEVVVTR